ncbi:hypothetical protein PHYC_03427 [Phycisphaerales bacterium]|nr:hypothetical protein PHYC_03427 [Phycisphaerales bacterium]
MPTPSAPFLISLLLAAGGCAQLAPSQSSRPPAPAALPPAATQAPGADDRIAASSIRERAIQLIEELSKSSDPQVRANAVEAASIVPNRLSEVVERGLHDPNPAVRSVAALAVGRSRITDLADQLSPLQSDPTPHVRISVILALVNCGQPVDRTPLANYLLEDPSPWVRRHAAFVLGEIGDRSALPLLRTAVRDSFPPASAEQVKILQLQISEAMIKLGDDHARQVLRASLYPSRPEELETAAIAVQIIGQLRDRDSIDQLIYLSEYRDRSGRPYPAEIRLGIASALASMGLKQGGFVADEFLASDRPELRAQAAFAYGEIGGRASWEKLDGMMSDPHSQVQIAAAAGILRSSVKP